MTRAERKYELTGLLADQSGRGRLLDAFIAAFGYLEPPPHETPHDIIEGILNWEYPHLGDWPTLRVHPK